MIPAHVEEVRSINSAVENKRKNALQIQEIGIQ